MKDCIVNATTHYSTIDYLKGLSEEQVARLRQLGWDYPEKREHMYTLAFVGMLSEIGATKQEFPEIGDIAICKVRGLDYDQEFVSALSQNQFHSVELQAVSGVSPIQISVYNEALLSLRTVDYMEDACTRALQEKLNEGWKIIAVCPSNDSRRPTYILGHREEGVKL